MHMHAAQYHVQRIYMEFTQIYRICSVCMHAKHYYTM